MDKVVEIISRIRSATICYNFLMYIGDFVTFLRNVCMYHIKGRGSNSRARIDSGMVALFEIVTWKVLRFLF